MFQAFRGRVAALSPRRRSLFLAVLAGLLVGGFLVPIGAFSASPETDSASGIVKVKAPNRCQVTNTGMDVTADTKVAAIMVTDLPGTYVERVVRKESNDRLKVCLNKQAVGTVQVSWIAHNGASVKEGFGDDTNWAALGRGGECTLGEVILQGGLVANGMIADGRLLDITQHEALFSLFGTRYGGDGRTTFGIPDLASAAPDGLTYSICFQGIYPSRL